MFAAEIASFVCAWALQRTAIRTGRCRGRSRPSSPGMHSAGSCRVGWRRPAPSSTRCSRAQAFPDGDRVGARVVTVIQFADAPRATDPGRPRDHRSVRLSTTASRRLCGSAGLSSYHGDRGVTSSSATTVRSSTSRMPTEWVLNRVRPRRPPTTGLDVKLKTERDEMAKTFGNRGGGGAHLRRQVGVRLSGAACGDRRGRGQGQPLDRPDRLCRVVLPRDDPADPRRAWIRRGRPCRDTRPRRSRRGGGGSRRSRTGSFRSGSRSQRADRVRAAPQEVRERAISEA